MTSVAAVVLAAGASSRFGSAKQKLLAPLVLERLRAVPVDRIVVVAGAHPLTLEAEVVHCPEWRRGPGASLRCGLRALGPEVDVAVVVLADGPDLAPAAVERVVERQRATGAEVVAASYGGERSHPVALARSVWARVPDEGARALEPVLVPCDDLGAPGDVDSADEWKEGCR